MNGENFYPDEIVKVEGELVSRAIYNLEGEEISVTVSADGVYDYAKKKNQEDINNDVETAIESWNNTYTEYVEPQIASAIETANRAKDKTDDLNGEIENIKTALSSKASVASVEELTAEIADLLSNNVTVSCSIPSNKRYFYKGYPISSLTVSSSVQNAKASDITNYAIFKGNERIGDAQSGVTSLSRTVNNISQDTQFRATLSLNTNNGVKQKQSSVVSVTGLNPIYKGQQRIDDLTSLADPNSEASASVFASINGIQENLYSRETPTNTIVGKTVEFNVEDRYRAWVITTTPNLGATEGSAPFPLYRYNATLNGISYYLYVSQNVYSDGKHSLVFNSNGNY